MDWSLPLRRIPAESAGRPFDFVRFLVFGFTCTAVGTYVMTATMGEQLSCFFYDYLTANAILTNYMVFTLVHRFSQPASKPFSPANGLLHQIGENTLALCLFHVMVLESLQKGYLGFKKRHDKIDDNDSAEALQNKKCALKQGSFRCE